MNEPSIRGAATVSAGFIVGMVALAYSVGGVFHSSNSLVLVNLVLFAGGLLLWAMAVASLISGLECLISRRRGKVAAYTSCAVLLAGAPVAAYALLPFVYRYVELRDFNAIGVTALRSEVATLMDAARATPADSPGPPIYTQPKLSDLPPRIRRIAEPRLRASLLTDGLFVTTDGLASVRSGYFITPTGSRFVPKQARTITDGIYYVRNPWEEYEAPVSRE